MIISLYFLSLFNAVILHLQDKHAWSFTASTQANQDSHPSLEVDSFLHSWRAGDVFKAALMYWGFDLKLLP